MYDIDENRNYFAIRLLSLVYTLLFALMISVMLVMWVFGNSLYSYFLQKFPFVVPILLINDPSSKEIILVSITMMSSFEKGMYLVKVSRNIINGKIERSIKKADIAPNAPT